MLYGTTFEDLELATGKLHFYTAFELSNLTVEILDEKDLLRLKYIAIDTSLTAISEGGDFTRQKDLKDIVNLSKSLNISIEQMQEMYKEYTISCKTTELLNIYKEKGLDESLDYIESLKIKSLKKKETESQSKQDIKNTSVDWNMLSSLTNGIIYNPMENNKAPLYNDISLVDKPLDQKIAAAKSKGKDKSNHHARDKICIDLER